MLEIARELAATAPLDMAVADGLEQIATWNAATLLSADLDED